MTFPATTTEETWDKDTRRGQKKNLVESQKDIDIGREKDFLAATAKKERLRISDPRVGKLSIKNWKVLHFRSLITLGAATTEEEKFMGKRLKD